MLTGREYTFQEQVNEFNKSVVTCMYISVYCTFSFMCIHLSMLITAETFRDIFCIVISWGK